LGRLDLDGDDWSQAMSPSGSRPRSFESLRRLPLAGRVMDWGLGPSAASAPTRAAEARIAGLKVTESVCPFCAVGCGQLVYTRAGELVDIEGNPRSPINQGTLCPKGASSRQLVQQPGRLTKVRYRAPGATEWKELVLEQARATTVGRTPTATAGASTAPSDSPTWAERRSTTRRTI
jgi:formate dehydrogenase major subunit